MLPQPVSPGNTADTARDMLYRGEGAASPAFYKFKLR